MLNSGQNDEVSDTTGDDSSNVVGKIKKPTIMFEGKLKRIFTSPIYRRCFLTHWSS
jgi:hypothetical protein